MKKIFFGCFFLGLLNLSFAQIIVEDDSSYTQYHSDLFKEIENRFRLEKNYDFELQLWISHPKMINNKVFLLTFNNDSWSGRLFEKNYKSDTLFEINIKQAGLKKLWTQLNASQILLIPKEEDLSDKNGKEIDYPVHHATRYSFSLNTKYGKRHYLYTCPKMKSQEYKYIKAYRNVVRILNLIFNYCGLKDSYIC